MYKFLRDVIFEVFVVNWPFTKISSSKFHWQTLAVMCLTDKNFLRAGDPRKYNRENAGFLTSSKFTYLENLCVYGIENSCTYGCFGYKSRCGICVLMHLKEELVWVIDKWLRVISIMVLLKAVIRITKELRNKATLSLKQLYMYMVLINIVCNYGILYSTMELHI